MNSDKMRKNDSIFRNASSNYYFASKFFAKDVREDVFVLYAYARVVDEFVDKKIADITGLEKMIQATKEKIKKVRIDDEIVSEMIDMATRVGIKHEWIESFLLSMKSDLTKKNYDLFIELEDYMYGSAEVIGMMMVKIMKISDENLDAARKLGKAFQLINFVRDIAEDAKIGRDYLGLRKLSNIEKKQKIFQYLDIYENLVYEAKHFFKNIPYRSRLAVKIATLSYDWTAYRIRKNPLLPYEKKIKPSILLRFWWLLISV